MSVVMFFCFKQKTAYEMRISDWSSDVCSSDLLVRARPSRALLRRPAACDEAARGARAISKRSEPIADQEIAEDKESRAAIGFNQIETRSGRASALCPDRKSTRLNSSH